MDNPGEGKQASSNSQPFGPLLFLNSCLEQGCLSPPPSLPSKVLRSRETFAERLCCPAMNSSSSCHLLSEGRAAMGCEGMYGIWMISMACCADRASRDGGRRGRHFTREEGRERTQLLSKAHPSSPPPPPSPRDGQGYTFWGWERDGQATATGNFTQDLCA